MSVYNPPAGGGGGTPGGSTTQIQYNNAGSFGGSANNTWNNSTNTTTITGGAIALAKSNVQFTYETAPTAPTIALVTTGTGNCTNGTHRVQITFVTANGETEAGTQSSVVTVDNTHKQISLSAIPVGTSGVVTGRNIYMTKNGGTTFFRLGTSPTINDNTTTTFTINIADTSLSATTVPMGNTTGGGFYVNGTLRALFNNATGYFGASFTSDFAFLGNGNEAFGMGSSAPAVNSTALGSLASSTGQYSTAIGSRASTAGATSVAIGYLATATSSGTNGVAIGIQSNVSAINAIAIGYGSSSAGSSGIAIGFISSVLGSTQIAIGASSSVTGSASNAGAFGGSATNTTGLNNSIVFNYTDYFWNNTSTSPNAVYHHGADVLIGNSNEQGGDYNIMTGRSTGNANGGNFNVYQSPKGISGGSQNTANLHMRMFAQSGNTVFYGEPRYTSDPITYVSGVLTYADGTFFTGIPTSGVDFTYDVYAKTTVNGIDVWSLTPANYPLGTDNNSTVTITNSPTSPIATEVSGFGYFTGDTVDYQIYAECFVNGNELYYVNPATPATVTISGVTGDIQVTWTDGTYPIESITQQIVILRNLNGAGFNDYQIVPAGTQVLNDNASGWSGGSTLTNTVVQNYLRNTLVWTNPPATNGIKILRNGIAQNIATATTFVDDGSYPFIDLPTVTPHSVPATKISINDITGSIRVNDLYTLPDVDGTAGQKLTTDGAGTVYWS